MMIRKTSLIRSIIVSAAALLLLPGCNIAAAQPTPTLLPTATIRQIPAATPVPTFERAYHVVSSPSPTRLTQTPTADPNCEVEASLPSIHYTVAADVDYAQHVVVIQQDIGYINRTNTPLSELVLNVEANRWIDVFTLERITSQTVEIPYDLNGRRLTLSLTQPLASNCRINLEVTFRLDVPPVGEEAYAFKGYFGYTDRQLNLGHWLPTVAVRQGDEWITRDALLIGEQDVLEDADWDVTISLIGSIIPMIAAPGTVIQLNDTTSRYTHLRSRDFTVSMSEVFNLTTQQTESGVSIELYSLPDSLVTLNDGVQVDSAAHALDAATEALELYSNLFGAYLYERLVIVEGDFPDGMEHSGFVFVSTDWFSRFTGDPASYLTLITVHEVAHQWWYARVGNDAAINPWLDEALSTYSEYIYLENFYPQLRDWWWQTRVDLYSPSGFVDSTVYEFSSIREYINAVYLRGVRMMHDLREDLGTEAFLAWLRMYAEAADGRIATPDDFWSLLTPEQLLLTQTTRDLYLRRAQVGTP